MKGLPEAWSKDGQSAAHLATNMSRPNSLFGHHTMTTGSGGSESAHDLKDLYLQDLSDGSYLVNPLINGRNPRSKVATHFDRKGHPRSVLLILAGQKHN